VSWVAHGQKTWWPSSASEDVVDNYNSWFTGGKPNCRNELAAVYRAKNQTVGSTGCSYLHYDGARGGGYQFPNCNSKICDDIGFNPGHPAVTYTKSTRVSYYTTGTGKLVWWINTVSGKENPFAPIPDLDPGEAVVGVEQVGSLVYLFTTRNIFTAPVTPVPSTFTGIGITMAELSIAANLQTIVDTAPSSSASSVVFYLTGGSGLNNLLYTLRFNPAPATTSVPIQGLGSKPRQMFYSTGLGKVVVTNTTDFLHFVDSSNGMVSPIAATTTGTVAAAVNGDYYYSANADNAVALNVKTGKRLWYSKINGAPILGNFVYLA